MKTSNNGGQDQGADLVVVSKTGYALSKLDRQEKKRAILISRETDPNDPQFVMSYGIAPQQQLSEVSSQILEKVRTGEIGPASESLQALLGYVKTMKVPDAGILGIFKRAADHTGRIVSKFEKVNSAIDQILSALQKDRDLLVENISWLDALYNENMTAFRELLIFVAAGEMTLEKLKGRQEQLRVGAESDPLSAQEYNRFAQDLERFERRISDLRLAAAVALQTAPEIRMIQNGSTALVEKIQTSILMTVPLWKAQLALAVSLIRQGKVLETQRKVSKTTEDLLVSNARMLQEQTVEIAREVQRGVISLETLERSFEYFTKTMEEILAIQEEGRRQRQETEKKLENLEQDVRLVLVGKTPTKLLQEGKD